MLTRITIETPRDSRAKYAYEPESRAFMLKKLLPLGMAFPFDFGLVPGTQGEDGDPVDAMVISEFTTFPGCMVDCRLIGMLQAEQAESGKRIRNDRYFFIPESSVIYQHIKTMDDLPAQLLKELKAFFVNYNKIEGKQFKPLKVIAANKALQLLKKAMKK